MDVKPEWSSEIIRELIQLWSEEEILYDVNHKDYRNIKKKHVIYSSFGVKLNKTSKEVQEKIKNLRSQYLQELKKIRLSKNNGSVSDDVYTSKWRFFNQLQFLRRSSQVNTSASNLSGFSDDGGVLESIEEVSLDFLEEEGEAAEAPGPKRSDCTPRAAPKRCKAEDNVVNVSLQCRGRLTKQEDDCDLYCRHLATQLRKLGEQPRLIAKKRIDDLMFEMLISPSTSFQGWFGDDTAT